MMLSRDNFQEKHHHRKRLSACISNGRSEFISFDSRSITFPPHSNELDELL